MRIADDGTSIKNAHTLILLHYIQTWTFEHAISYCDSFQSLRGVSTFQELWDTLKVALLYKEETWTEVGQQSSPSMAVMAKIMKDNLPNKHRSHFLSIVHTPAQADTLVIKMIHFLKCFKPDLFYSTTHRRIRNTQEKPFLWIMCTESVWNKTLSPTWPWINISPWKSESSMWFVFHVYLRFGLGATQPLTLPHLGN